MSATCSGTWYYRIFLAATVAQEAAQETVLCHFPLFTHAMQHDWPTTEVPSWSWLKHAQDDTPWAH